MPEISRQKMSPLSVLGFQSLIAIVAIVAFYLTGTEANFGELSVAYATLLGVLGGMLTYFALFLLTLGGVFSSSSLRDQMRFLHEFACSYSWPVLLTLSVLAGFGEELLFRGVVQGWLTEQFGVVFALAAAAILFGLVHFLSLAYFVMATVLGVVLGLAYIWSESLLMTMVWHGAYDVVALYCLRRYPHRFGVD
ncbi:MAG: CPBP family intramembrane glutamic endopeptidase [Marinobacter sp.]|nr:CPBP family intramembrane glutamic endopeptidase [Marinobacter sp.]